MIVTLHACLCFFCSQVHVDCLSSATLCCRARAPRVSCQCLNTEMHFKLLELACVSNAAYQRVQGLLASRHQLVVTDLSHAAHAFVNGLELAGNERVVKMAGAIFVSTLVFIAAVSYFVRALCDHRLSSLEGDLKDQHSAVADMLRAQAAQDRCEPETGQLACTWTCYSQTSEHALRHQFASHHHISGCCNVYRCNEHRVESHLAGA